ncbi:MAG: hypothetical protein LBS69_11865 [Prevotellaceae bacterium]|jgi:hypothetical protein|nr:hypothetical protein [Prevotellaceae bacterium]
MKFLIALTFLMTIISVNIYAQKGVPVSDGVKKQAADAIQRAYEKATRSGSRDSGGTDIVDPNDDSGIMGSFEGLGEMFSEGFSNDEDSWISPRKKIKDSKEAVNKKFFSQKQFENKLQQDADKRSIIEKFKKYTGIAPYQSNRGNEHSSTMNYFLDLNNYTEYSKEEKQAVEHAQSVIDNWEKIYPKKLVDLFEKLYLDKMLSVNVILHVFRYVDTFVGQTKFHDKFVFRQYGELKKQFESIIHNGNIDHSSLEQLFKKNKSDIHDKGAKQSLNEIIKLSK